MNYIGKPVATVVQLKHMQCESCNLVVLIHHSNPSNSTSKIKVAFSGIVDKVKVKNSNIQKVLCNLVPGIFASAWVVF